MVDHTDLEKRIRGYMSDYRYEHTLSVAAECKRLAALFSVDEEKLVTAAYLHDITKEMPTDMQISLCREYGIALDESTLNSPKTLHSFSAPALIMRDMPELAHPDVITAVTYHTTGRANMGIYEKLLYLADYIEPKRTFDDCIAVRELFNKNEGDPYKRLDDAILLSLKYTVSDLVSKGRYIHIETIKAYNWLLSAKPGE